ncbi:hypothetical protein Poli38472_004858 [Pythium oligandrum]|uniref:Uncharacterized protein n=1 Tax=Pythium oligandrum TaxID=41045 RepID=A0A8K1FG99_PYTOL|nr:hypothetical protein Poli38472_004858 [Pythium oligandrum]|eukprot:TMW59789.1 hypothetical protein Poli38472_004858 [Pythium oligandrum]
MRAEADQLTRRLERLRAQQQTPPVRAHETQNTEKSLLRAKIWKSVSDRQLERREEAEQENKRLREMLDEQNMVIKSLERLMRKQYRVDETMFASQIRRLELDPDTDGSEDEDLDGMLDDLLGMYAEVDLILADSRFRLATPYRDVCLRNDSMPVAAIESVDVRILPFACDRTANAIWSRIQEGSTPSSSASLGQDSMVRRVKGSVTYPRLDSAYQGWVAVHRFIDSTRIVITCQTLASVDVTAPRGKRGYISLRHKSWYILYPIELEDEGAQVPTPATRVQLYQMISPEGGGQGDGTLDDLIHLWTTAVLETVEDHVEARQRALENLLLATECQ